jgi:hypothetical protein
MKMMTQFINSRHSKLNKPKTRRKWTEKSPFVLVSKNEETRMNDERNFWCSKERRTTKTLVILVIGRHSAIKPQAFCNYFFFFCFSYYNYEEKITNIHPKNRRRFYWWLLLAIVILAAELYKKKTRKNTFFFKDL